MTVISASAVTFCVPGPCDKGLFARHHDEVLARTAKVRAKKKEKAAAGLWPFLNESELAETLPK